MRRLAAIRRAAQGAWLATDAATLRAGQLTVEDLP